MHSEESSFFDKQTFENKKKLLLTMAECYDEYDKRGLLKSMPTKVKCSICGKHIMNIVPVVDSNLWIEHPHVWEMESVRILIMRIAVVDNDGLIKWFKSVLTPQLKEAVDIELGKMTQVMWLCGRCFQSKKAQFGVK